MAALYGWHAAVGGWNHYPFGWLANPLLWIGVVLLLRGKTTGAAVCGWLALIPVVQWTLEWKRLGLWDMVTSGYYLWAASVGVLVVGASILWSLECLNSCGERTEGCQMN